MGYFDGLEEKFEEISEGVGEVEMFVYKV